MRLKNYLAALLGWCLLQPSVLAYPGGEIGQSQKWLMNHQAFPNENFFTVAGARGGVGKYLVLEKNRELVLTVHYDRALTATPQRVLFERVSLFHQRLATELPCHEALLQGAADTGLISAAMGESFNRTWSACLMYTNVDFRQRSAASTVQALATIYGAQDPLLADFQSARPIYTGHQYLTPVWQDTDYERTMIPIQSGPIEEQIYQGNLFDYLVTSNTLTIVDKHESGYWNNWDLLQQDLEEQQAQYQSMQPQQQAAKP